MNPPTGRPACPRCGSRDTLPAESDTGGGFESPTLVVSAGLLVVGVLLAAASVILVGGWTVWLLAGLVIAALALRRRARQEEAAPGPAAPQRWYCPECERSFPE